MSCKNVEKKEDNVNKTSKQEDKLTLIKGEFVYYDDAAVLQTKSNIYGVFVTDKMLELNKLAEKHKAIPTDMVYVEVKGIISNKKDDKILWENKVEIVEILNVSPSNKDKNNVVKLVSE
ncbi:hypothetical protein GCM10022291_10830 [Postechiella marina]|uniref:Lipoprotein n=1 Tax=Postechiella marina TaxID=943941 RepID=A0ABP8C4F5_9FLAO